MGLVAALPSSFSVSRVSEATPPSAFSVCGGKENELRADSTAILALNSSIETPLLFLFPLLGSAPHLAKARRYRGQFGPKPRPEFIVQVHLLTCSPPLIGPKFL